MNENPYASPTTGGARVDASAWIIMAMRFVSLFFTLASAGLNWLIIYNGWADSVNWFFAVVNSFGVIVFSRLIYEALPCRESFSP